MVVTNSNYTRIVNTVLQYNYGTVCTFINSPKTFARKANEVAKVRVYNMSATVRNKNDGQAW